MRESKDRRQNTVIGHVISDKMDKTITVFSYRLVRHPKYKKYLRQKSVFKVHDEKNQARKGNRVKILSVRPQSKTKRWRLMAVLDSKEISSSNESV